MAATFLTGSLASRAEETAPGSTSEGGPVVVPSEVDYTGGRGVSEVAVGSEVRGLRTAYSSSYETEIPGMLRMDVSDEPVNFETPSGSWRRIDTDLVEQDDGAGFRTTANSTTVEIAATADADALAAVDLGGGVGTSFALEGAADVEPDIEGSSATFSEVLPGVDLALEARPNRLKETLILAGPTAERSFTFPLDFDGLVARLDEVTGSIELREAPTGAGSEPGEVRLRIPPGFMNDSATGPDGPAFSDGVTYRLVDDDAGAQALEVELDDEFLDDPARVWPVAVDPNYQFTEPLSGTDDTYVAEGSVADNGASTTLAIGESAGGDSQRALLNFPIVPTAGLDVHQADLVLTHASTPCPSTAPMHVAAATSAWMTAPATFPTWPGPTMGDPLLPDADLPVSLFSNCLTGRVRGQITPIVDDWYHGTLANHGLVLSALDEDDGAQRRSFHSANASANQPKIQLLYTIDHASGPNTPSDLTPGAVVDSGHPDPPGREISTLNPTLMARYSHPGTPALSGGLWFEVRYTASRLVLAYVQLESSPGVPVILPSGTRGGIDIAGALPAGESLDWRATAFNTVAVGSPPTRWSASSPWRTIITPDTVGCSDPNDDPSERNDSVATATAWNGTSVVNGRICADPDVYRFTTSGTPDLEVTVDIDDGVDLDVAVYDNTGTLLELLDSTDPTETYEFDAAGTFYVEVYGYRGASGTYSLDGEAL